MSHLVSGLGISVAVLTLALLIRSDFAPPTLMAWLRLRFVYKTTPHRVHEWSMTPEGLLWLQLQYPGPTSRLVRELLGLGEEFQLKGHQGPSIPLDWQVYMWHHDGWASSVIRVLAALRFSTPAEIPHGMRQWQRTVLKPWLDVCGTPERVRVALLLGMNLETATTRVQAPDWDWTAAETLMALTSATNIL